MRVAALFDVHGNLPALEAVLDEVRLEGVDLLVIGGDVFPGPLAIECLGCLLALDMPVRFLCGNGDRETLALAQGGEVGRIPEPHLSAMRWTAERLTTAHRAAVAEWPATLRCELAGMGEALFCHATPESDTAIFTRLTPEKILAPAFLRVGAPMVICGHTHMQFDRAIGDTRVINAGSVGMPFGDPGAYWLLLGGKPQLRRTVYDLERAAERIRASSNPQARDFAERNVLRPPSEEQMLALFNGAAPG